jgi:hypothetical protein
LVDSEIPDTELKTGLRLGAPTSDPGVSSGYRPNLSDLLKQKHAETASRLAGRLIWILAGTILLHYVSVIVLIYLKRDDAIKELADILHAWLPVLAGLAGGAATYYFTRDKEF